MRYFAASRGPPDQNWTPVYRKFARQVLAFHLAEMTARARRAASWTISFSAPRLMAAISKV